MAYAEKTIVDVGKTRDEIERMLQRKGSNAFLAGNRDGKIFVAFELNNLKIRFQISQPNYDDFRKTETGKTRAEAAARSCYEQAQKQRWRSLFLSIKAKLVSIDEGIETFEEAFLAHIVTNDNQTIGERIIPRLPEATAEAEIKLLTA